MDHKAPKHGHHKGHHEVNKSHSGHPGRGAHASETTLHQGLIRNEPNAVDASTRCKGPSVNAEATRNTVARTPGTLGPRAA